MASVVVFLLGGLALFLASARRRLRQRDGGFGGLGDVRPIPPLPVAPRPLTRPTSSRALHPSFGPYVPPAPVPSSAASTRVGGLPVQLLFATPSDLEDVLVLDCIVGADGELAGVGPALRQGTPFTVKADLTCTAEWATMMIESLLDRWTHKGTPVQMVILDGSSGREVRLFDQDSRVQLPLAA